MLNSLVQKGVVTSHGLTFTVELIEPEVARYYMTKNRGNRKQIESRINSYSNVMGIGNWRLNGEPIIFTSDDNLISGQHRLLAGIKAGVAFISVVIRGVDPNNVHDIDTGKSRSGADILEMRGIKNSSALAQMIRVIINTNRGHHISAATSSSAEHDPITNGMIRKFALENLASLQESFEICKNDQIFSRAHLAAVHFVYKSRNQKKADDFMLKLTRGVKLENDSPIYKLRQLMIQHKSASKKPTRYVRHGLIFKAMELYFEGRTCQVLSWKPADGFPYKRNLKTQAA